MLATDYSCALQSVSQSQTHQAYHTHTTLPRLSIVMAQCRTDSQMALTGWVSPRWG